MLVFAVALSLLATACTSSPDTLQTPLASGPENQRQEQEMALASGVPTTIDIGSGMSISVDEDDLAGPGVVRTRRVDVELPEIAGFTPAGTPVEIDFAAKLATPVTLSFEGANGPKDGVPVVYRLDPDLGWYPVAFGELGTPAVGERKFFSVHVPGWLNPRQWMDSAVGRFRGRTDPPTCGDDPPPWATVSQPPVDILLACGTSNDADDGAERVEARIKNNRGLMSQVTLPPGLDFAFIEGQPEVTRAAIRRLAGDRDVALLPSGSFMSVGFRRPASSTTQSITPMPSQLAMIMDLFQVATDLPGNQQALASMHIAALALENCGLARRTLFDQPDSLGDFASLATETGTCLISFARDPGKAATIAAEAVAAVNGVDVAVATGDGAFASQVDSLAGALRAAGSLINVVKLGSMAHDYFEFSAEQLALNTEDAASQDLVSVNVEMVASLQTQTGTSREQVLNMALPRVHSCSYADDFDVPATLSDGELYGPNGGGMLVADVILEDIDGDGETDGIAQVTCSSGAAGTSTGIFIVNGGVSSELAYTEDASIRSPELSVYRVERMTISGESLVLTAYGHGAEDPTCCPSYQVILKYRIGRPDSSPELIDFQAMPIEQQ